MMNPKKIFVLVALALFSGIGVTLLAASVWGIPWVESSAKAAAGDASDGHEHADDGGSGAYYTCPMHPSVVSDKPGACPVCQMDLIKKKKSGGGMDPQELAAMGKVSLSPTQQVLANVQTTEVEAVDAKSEIRAVGIVTYDETGLATIPSWVNGRIERLLVEETGTTVRRGQPVIKIYSPELLTAQEEFLVALDNSEFDKSLVTAARRRLKLLGMSERQIDRLERTRKVREYITMFAPDAGTITDLKVRQGQYVDEGTALYEIADLSTVWIEAEVYEHNLGDIEEGMKVRVTADAFDGESTEGEVTFIHPVLDKETRTVKVRIELDNSEQKLKPGMYTTVFFKNDDAQADEPELVVPKSAVIRGGKSNSVYVEVDDNLFERRQVELGRATDEYLVVKSGVESGEAVAYQGGFLLDSEVQLNSFGGSEGAHGEEGAKAEKAKKINADDVPKGGKKLEPPVPVASVPEGMWVCDMGTTHWVQHEKGEGECPVCGMILKQKGAREDKAEGAK